MCSTRAPCTGTTTIASRLAVSHQLLEELGRLHRGQFHSRDMKLGWLLGNGGLPLLLLKLRLQLLQTQVAVSADADSINKALRGRCYSTG